MKTHALVQRYGHEVVRDFEVASRLFASENPTVLNLSVAENVLLFPEVIERIHALAPLGKADLMYTESYGTKQMRESAAAMLNATLAPGDPLGESHLSGFSSTRATLLRLLEPLVGDEVPFFLVPTPCWQGFTSVLEDALRGRIVRVESGSADNFSLSLPRIIAAYEDTVRIVGREPVALILTNPGNPVGRNISREQLDEIAAWVLDDTGMQLVSDEIYAHSQVPQPSTPFTSLLTLPRAAEPGARPRVHVAWGFAKDFGLSGFRIGLYLCRDENRHVQARKNAQWSPFDSYNSVTMAASVVGPQGEPGQQLMVQLKQRLGFVHEAIVKELAVQKIPCASDTDAALFFWLDLRAWLELVPPSVVCPPLVGEELLATARDDRENRLRRYLVCKAQVDLAPGTQFLFDEPGFFRMCHTAAEPDEVIQGVCRIGSALRELES